MQLHKLHKLSVRTKHSRFYSAAAIAVAVAVAVAVAE